MTLSERGRSTWKSTVESLFCAWSSCLSTHDQLDFFGTLDPHTSGPHHPTMGGTSRATFDKDAKVSRPVRRERGGGNAASPPDPLREGYLNQIDKGQDEPSPCYKCVPSGMD